MKRTRVLACIVVVATVLLIALSSVLAVASPGVLGQEGALTPAEGNPNEDKAAAPTEVELAQMLTASLAGSAYLVLPPAAFTSDGYDPDGFFIALTDPSACYFKGQVATDACLVAPIQLPQGVTIKGIEVRLEDSNNAPPPAGVEWFRLLRTSLTSGIPEVIAEVTSPEGTTGGLVGLVDNTVQNGTVDNMYTYQLVTCARQDIWVYGVRVGYSYSIALPLVTR